MGAGIHLPAEGVDAVVSLADELYRRRAEGDIGPRLLASLESCAGATDCYEIQWRVSRAMFIDGQAAGEDALRFHEAGVAHGGKAIRLNRSRVEGHFWLGVNMALLAQQSNPLRAAAAVLRARRELRCAAAICRQYHGAGPLRVLGRLEHKAPWFLGGGVRHSRVYYDRALELAPGNCVTLMYAAELAIDQGEPDRASELLRAIIESPADPAWEFEHRRDKETAREMLVRLK